MASGRGSVEAVVDGGHRIREPRLLGVQERRATDTQRVGLLPATRPDAAAEAAGALPLPDAGAAEEAGAPVLPRPPLLFRD